MGIKPRKTIEINKVPESVATAQVSSSSSLAEKYGITKRYARKFAENPNFRYDSKGEEREINNPSPKTALNKDDTDQCLTDNFQAADGSPLWADRTTGREVSPVDFIKLHYGRTNPDGTWDSQGLTRSELRQRDRKLYQAYASWIAKNRHPEDDLHLEKIEPKKFDAVEDALKHKRNVMRDASARYRERQRQPL